MESDNNEISQKKPFDKKNYRFKKYSNKFQVKKWEERRKKSIQRDYFKSLGKEERQNLLSKNKPDSKEFLGGNKKNGFTKAKEDYIKKQKEKEEKRKCAEQQKIERNLALEKYKEKKLQKFKALSRRTKKGQPLMRDRIKLLLEKIQQTV